VVKSVTGMDNVFQLRGGIHRYIEQFGAGGLFRGRNFVFDKRVLQPVQPAQPTGSAGASTVCDTAAGAAVEVVGQCR
jgi:predicted sulfurtransferase